VDARRELRVLEQGEERADGGGASPAAQRERAGRGLDPVLVLPGAREQQVDDGAVQRPEGLEDEGPSLGRRVAQRPVRDLSFCQVRCQWCISQMINLA